MIALGIALRAIALGVAFACLFTAFAGTLRILRQEIALRAINAAVGTWIAGYGAIGGVGVVFAALAFSR